MSDDAATAAQDDHVVAEHGVEDHEHEADQGEHDTVQHGDHVDFLHGEHRHARHGDHYDEH